jgi:hypothetical protein
MKYFFFVSKKLVETASTGFIQSKYYILVKYLCLIGSIYRDILNFNFNIIMVWTVYICIGVKLQSSSLNVRLACLRTHF